MEIIARGGHNTTNRGRLLIISFISIYLVKYVLAAVAGLVDAVV